MFTGGDLVVVGGGAVRQHVLNLEELVGAVPPDDGEAEAQGALPQRSAQDVPLQLGRVPGEHPPRQRPARLLWNRKGIAVMWRFFLASGHPKRLTISPHTHRHMHTRIHTATAASDMQDMPARREERERHRQASKIAPAKFRRSTFALFAF